MIPKVVRHNEYRPAPYRYVGRPSVWGNPFVIGKDGTREEVVAKYRAWLEQRPAMVARAKTELRGKNLGCFCSPLPCHADILLAVSNGWPLPVPKVGA